MCGCQENDLHCVQYRVGSESSMQLQRLSTVSTIDRFISQTSTLVHGAERQIRGLGDESERSAVVRLVHDNSDVQPG